MSHNWEKAVTIIDTLEKNGYEAYFVGGCVRDSLLERPIKDIDITTSAAPEEVIALFNHVIPTGLEHGTVLIRYHGSSFEVTTYRGERISLKEPFPVARSLKEDLSRRDFTMNAIAMDKHGEFIDFFGGKYDLEAGIIKTVGDADERFREDALRMLRALRFASQLGFVVEPDTLHQINQMKASVKEVAVERIREECEKFFQGRFVLEGVALLRVTGLYHYLPIFDTYPELVKQLTQTTLTAFESFADVIAILHYLDNRVSIPSWVKAWKCSNKDKRRAIALHTYLAYYDHSGLDEWLVYQIEPAYINAFCHLTTLIFPDNPLVPGMLQVKREKLPIQERKDIALDGSRIAALFPERNKGRWIKEVMEEVEYLVVSGRLTNDQSTIKEWILCHPPGKN